MPVTTLEEIIALVDALQLRGEERRKYIEREVQRARKEAERDRAA